MGLSLRHDLKVPVTNAEKKERRKARHELQTTVHRYHFSGDFKRTATLSIQVLSFFWRLSVRA